MVDKYSRPSLPLPVARQLRQEAGFGCAKCGHPYIEYHHIVPWSEEQHYRPDDMVALCGNCHVLIARLGKDRQYEVKNNPKNIREGLLRGALVYDKRDLTFLVGGNYYVNTPIILQYKDIPVVACSLQDGQAKLTLNLFDKSGNSIFQVFENEVVFRPDAIWDFEYGHNWVTVRHGPRQIALQINFRECEAVIRGKIWLGGNEVRLDPQSTNLPGNNTISGCHIVGSRVGISVH
ncbi:MAG: HNH endonuclease [Alphaproteobacteria bacterium]|nr:HNH endonuclease [Alphaproteobacteria bacterium]